jgi:CSLREA domain-containing protein
MKLLPRIFNIFTLAALLAAAGLTTTPLPAAHAAGGTTIPITIFTDNTITDTFCTLREAITNANNDAATFPDCPAGSGNDTITLANNQQQTITLGAPLPTITDADGLTLVGLNNSIGIISGNHAFRIFSVTSAPFTLKFMTLKEANAAQGGAIHSTGKLTIINSTFDGNQATQAGSSIYSNGPLTITNSTFSNNQQGFGAILNAANGSITNSTFYNNNSVGPGGVVFNQGKLTIKNSTFSNNSAGTFGANVYQSGSSASLQLYNNILANSNGGGECVNESGTVSGTNNLFENGSAVCGLNIDEDNISGVDPILPPVTGSPAHFPINFDSPAINTGSNTQCPAADQRGVTRPQGAQCDIGAYERIFGPAIRVTTNSDNTIADTHCSLREAINNANDNMPTFPDCVTGSGNDTIVFANNVSTITLGSTLPNIADIYGLTIRGGGDIRISGNNAVRIFNVLANTKLTLQSITLRNGKSSEGGGILNRGTLTVINSTFSGNHASGPGGGINSNNNLTIINSTFSGNSSTGLGSAVVNINGTTAITNSTFVDNIGSEGAIHNLGNGSIWIDNSTFYHNDSGLAKGVINNENVMAITNSTFSENSISGGLDIIQDFSPSAGITLQNNIFAHSLGGGHCAVGQGIISAMNNLMEDTDNVCQLSNGVGGNIIGSDPKLGPLAGSPAYLPLNSNSPAINAGLTIRDLTTSQNGVTRPSGADFDMGSFELPITTLTFASIAINDGWILESKETSGKGLTMNNAAATFNLGDDAADRQYRAILHFDTSSLPDNAAIVSAMLKIKKRGIVGTNPFSILGELNASIRKPAFGTEALALTDFKSAAGKNNVASFGVVPIEAWYGALINNTGKLHINLSGSTQFRLSFAIDDNDNNSNDHMKFYSGNAVR